MLSQNKRISTDSFKNIILKGDVFYSPFFTIRRLINNDESRFAVSAPKKICKTAVMRNKIRRRIYTAISSLENRFVSKQQIVIIIKDASIKLSLSQTKEELIKIFVKCGLLK